MSSVESIKQAGETGVWTAFVKPSSHPAIQGRVWALRKTDEAIEEAENQIFKTAQRKEKKPKMKRYVTRAM